jgi:hypothetical protein
MCFPQVYAAIYARTMPADLPGQAVTDRVNLRAYKCRAGTAPEKKERTSKTIPSVWSSLSQVSHTTLHD